MDYKYEIEKLKERIERLEALFPLKLEDHHCLYPHLSEWYAQQVLTSEEFEKELDRRVNSPFFGTVAWRESLKNFIRSYVIRAET